jgi:hypothetical protein
MNDQHSYLFYQHSGLLKNGQDRSDIFRNIHAQSKSYFKLEARVKKRRGLRKYGEK